jgi:hypothetical protein
MTQVIVLNGCSSSGKMGIARLRAILPPAVDPAGRDGLIDALPPSLNGAGAGNRIRPAGRGQGRGGFREAEDAWLAGGRRGHGQGRREGYLR